MMPSNIHLILALLLALLSPTYGDLAWGTFLGADWADAEGELSLSIIGYHSDQKWLLNTIALWNILIILACPLKMNISIEMMRKHVAASIHNLQEFCKSDVEKLCPNVCWNLNLCSTYLMDFSELEGKESRCFEVRHLTKLMSFILCLMSYV